VAFPGKAWCYTSFMLEVSARASLLAQPLDDVPFVIFDVESTGLEASAGDRIVEIAFIRWHNRTVVRRYETLVNPGRAITAAAYAVNRIDARELAQAPTFADIAPALLAEFEGAVLVAHNVPFDMHFLNTELALLGKPPLANVVLDTLTLSRAFLDHDRYSLAALSRELGFDRPLHRAMSDVLALQQLFDHLLNRLRMVGVSTLADLVRAQRGLLPGQPEPEAPPLIAGALRDGTRLRIAYRTRGEEPVWREILPLEFQTAREVPRLLAYCYLRNGQRTFYLDRIEEMVAVQEGQPQ
jgi:DNA polymerase III subunit epsilon